MPEDIVINRLKLENLFEAQKLLSSKKSVLGDPLPGFASDRIERLLKTSYYYIYGTYYKHELIGIGSAELWKNAPYYNISNFYLKRGFGVAAYQSFCNQTIKRIFLDMEHIGRFQFFMLTIFRNSQKRSFLIDNVMWRFPKKFNCFDNYDVSVEAIIKAGTKSDFNTYNWLMGERTFRSDLWIRRGVLKEKSLIPKLIDFYNLRDLVRTS